MTAPEYADRLRRSEWSVVDCPLTSAQRLVRAQHYAGGGSNTGVYVHGLVHNDDPLTVRGAAWWLPPTRVAAESVNREHWQQVLSLTRLVIEPDVPKNAATFLMAGSRRIIEREGLWVSLVTYADESRGHAGTIYLADGWDYAGRVGPSRNWYDAAGRQVAAKATVNRTKPEMIALGYVQGDPFYKRKFVRHLNPRRAAPRQGMLI